MGYYSAFNDNSRLEGIRRRMNKQGQINSSGSGSGEVQVVGGQGRHQISVNLLNDEDVEFWISIDIIHSNSDIILRSYFILITLDP